MLKHKVKVLIFAHDASLYGASMSLLTLIEHLQKIHDIEFFVMLPYHGNVEQSLSDLNIRFKVIPFPRNVISTQNAGIRKRVKDIYRYYKKRKQAKVDLKKLINEFNPDLIYTNTSVVSVGAELARELNIPHVWHIREYGTLDYNFSYLPTQSCVVRKIKTSDKIIFVSNALKEFWVDKKNNNSVVIYNGISGVKANKEALHYKSGELCEIAMLGAITSGKGQDIAIKSLIKLRSKFSNFRFTIYGDIIDKAYFEELKGLINNANCSDYISISPFVKDTEPIYQNLTILLNCSTNEGFGRTIIEAMSYGVPVIANKSGGPVEIISHLNDGLLYEHTVESLTEQLERLLTDEKLYEKISENAIKKVQDTFSVEKYINSVNDVFNTVLKII